MDDLLSPGAARILARAKRLAYVNGLQLASPIEIIAAMLDEPDGEPANCLRLAGVNLAEMRRLLPIDRDDEPQRGDSTISWNDHAQSILHRANEIAVAFTRLEPTSGQDILVALLEDPRDFATFLSEHGVDPARMVNEFHRGRLPPTIDIPSHERDWNASQAKGGVDLARVIDANLNRAREGLRVVEEYVRFVRDDLNLTERLKHARHSVAKIASLLPADWLILSRQTNADVGVALTTDREKFRSDVKSVVAANLKRLQEALRAIEEYTKIESPVAADIAKDLRYETYSVERLLFVAARAADRLSSPLLYWLCDPWACAASVEWTIREAAAGGVAVVQLRDKRSSDSAMLELARQMREWSDQLGLLFIVNDRPDIARLARADGVHLGQDDLPVREARRIVGADSLIGVSTHNVRQVRKAEDDGADYLGVGPIFPSKTKVFDEFAGLDFVRSARLATSLPIIAIGGINASNLDSVIDAGACRIAVSHAICATDEPRLVARQIVDHLAAAKAHSP